MPDVFTIRPFDPSKESDSDLYAIYHIAHNQHITKNGISINNSHDATLPSHIGIDFYSNPTIGLSRVNTSRLYVPNYDLYRGLKKNIAITSKFSCYTNIREFKQKDIPEKNLSDIKVGDFNSDFIPDIAYIYSPPNAPAHSTILYGQHLSTCSHENESFEVPIIEEILSLILSKQKHISANTISRISNTLIFCKKNDCSVESKNLITIAVAQSTSQHIYFNIHSILKFINTYPDSIQTFSSLFKKYDFLSEKQLLKLITMIQYRLNQPTQLLNILKIANEMIFKNSDQLMQALSALIDIANTVGDKHFFAFKFCEFSPIRKKNTTIPNTLLSKDTNDITHKLIKLSKITDKQTLIQQLEKNKKIPTDALIQYRDIIAHTHYTMTEKDISHAQNSIGAENAILLWKTFNIIHFSRYSHDLLRHMVQLASDPTMDNDKPLILGIIADHDYNDAFSNSILAYNKNLRIIYTEASNDQEFHTLPWHIRNKYGIPDILIIDAHGDDTRITLGEDKHDIDNTSYTAKLLKQLFHNFFGPATDNDHNKYQIILTSCRGGIKTNDNPNMATVFANAFNIPVTAARENAITVNLEIDINSKPYVHIDPIFFETEFPYYGFNFGESIFYPDDHPQQKNSTPYRLAAGMHNGFQLYMGIDILNLFSDIAMHAGGSYTHSFFNHLQTRINIGMDIHGISLPNQLHINPELSFGLNNHKLIALGHKIYTSFDKMDTTNAHWNNHTYAGIKGIFPHIHSEFFLGMTTHSLDIPEVNIAIGYESRF